MDHLSFIFNATDTKAYVDDKYTNRSVLLDANTKKPVETSALDPASGAQAEAIYVVERVDGSWKVTSSFRAVRSS
jgi:hypothetical protein